MEKNNKDRKGSAKVNKREKTRKPLSPSHTKGFYRFSKDFPSVTDKDGYRDNEVFKKSPEKKASLRRRLVAVFVAVFVLTFIGTSIAFAMSRLPIQETQEQSTEDSLNKVTLSGYNAVFLTGDVLSYSGISALTGEFSSYGINAVVIEFKDSSGYIYFRPSGSVVTEALYRVSETASEAVKSFKDAGFAVFASVSCFADDIYARNNQDYSAFVLTEQQSGELEEVKSLWYDGTADAHAWISPYSDKVTSYLSSLIRDIDSMGVTGIILNNVMLPKGAVTDGLSFPGQPEEGADIDARMAQFVSSVSSGVSCKVGAVVKGDIMLDAMNSDAPPSVLSSDIDYLVLDARLSGIPSGAEVGGKKFDNPNSSPYMFMLDFISASLSFAERNECEGVFMPIIEASDSSAVQISAVSAQSVNSYIMFNSEMIYSADNFEIK